MLEVTGTCNAATWVCAGAFVCGDGTDRKKYGSCIGVISRPWWLAIELTLADLEHCVNFAPTMPRFSALFP